MVYILIYSHIRVHRPEQQNVRTTFRHNTSESKRVGRIEWNLSS